MWKWLRMKFSAGLLRMAADRGVPLATNSKHKHSMFKHRLSSNGNALCLHNECSDDVWSNPRPCYKDFAEAKPAYTICEYARKEG